MQKLKNPSLVLKKKKRDIARLQGRRPKKVTIEKPSITDEIDMDPDWVPSVFNHKNFCHYQSYMQLLKNPL